MPVSNLTKHFRDLWCDDIVNVFRELTPQTEPRRASCHNSKSIRNICRWSCKLMEWETVGKDGLSVLSVKQFPHLLHELRGANIDGVDCAFATNQPDAGTP